VKRRVLVTGASRGIGRAIAVRLARDGFSLAINFRERRDDAEQTAKAIREAGGEAALLPFDVADCGACAEALAADDRRTTLPPMHGALLKNEQDIHLFERLIFLNRREGRRG